MRRTRLTVRMLRTAPIVLTIRVRREFCRVWWPHD
jgi:hypothetical protein